MKNSLQKNLVAGLGGGIAVADDNATMDDIQKPSPGDPAIPEKGLPQEPTAIDVEIFEKTNKVKFVGQHESDPSFLVFKDADGCNFKLPAASFRSGFRGSNDGPTY